LSGIFKKVCGKVLAVDAISFEVKAAQTLDKEISLTEACILVKSTYNNKNIALKCVKLYYFSQSFYYEIRGFNHKL